MLLSIESAITSKISSSRSAGVKLGVDIGFGDGVGTCGGSGADAVDGVDVAESCDGAPYHPIHCGNQCTSMLRPELAGLSGVDAGVDFGTLRIATYYMNK